MRSLLDLPADQIQIRAMFCLRYLKQANFCRREYMAQVTEYEVGQGRKIAKVKVNKKTFEIAFTSNIARKLSMDLFKMTDRINEILALKEPERTKQYDKLIEDKGSLDEAIVSRTECIKNILLSNNQEYDPEWWEGFTDTEMQNEFVYYCMMKDSPKKKAMERKLKK
jgi:hypothetical protein